MKFFSNIQKKSLEDQLYIIGLIFLAVGSVLIAFYLGVVVPHLSLPSCIWLEWFGIYCPGCGGTRAVWSLLHGHPLLSLWYHPLVGYGVVIYGGFMLSHTLEKLHISHVRGWRFHNWYLFGAIVLLAVNFIGKNLMQILWGITM